MAYHTIPTAYFQTTPVPTSVQCAACGKIIDQNTGTAGPYNADGKLTLICNEHLRSSRQFINLLADYITHERRRLAEKRSKTKESRRVEPDAWFLC